MIKIKSDHSRLSGQFNEPVDELLLLLPDHGIFHPARFRTGQALSGFGNWRHDGGSREHSNYAVRGDQYACFTSKNIVVVCFVSVLFAFSPFHSARSAPSDHQNSRDETIGTLNESAVYWESFTIDSRIAEAGSAAYGAVSANLEAKTGSLRH